MCRKVSQATLQRTGGILLAIGWEVMGRVKRNTPILDSEWNVYLSLSLMTARLHSGTPLGEDDGNQSWKLCLCQIREAIPILQLMNEPCQQWVYYNQTQSGDGVSGDKWIVERLLWKSTKCRVCSLGTGPFNGLQNNSISRSLWTLKVT